MRRISTAITAAALALSMTLGLNVGTAQAAPAGFDSAYQFESAFLNLAPNDSGTFSVFFANTGSTSWAKGSSSQVNLAICAADKVTCNVTSAQAAWAVNWLSSTAYATHTKDTVAPGDFSAFTYNIKVPAGTAGGTYRFNGDLVNGTTRVHPEGYYQDGTVSGAPAPGGAALTVTPGYSVSEDNEVSTTVPGIGQHTYTFQTTLTGTLSFAVITSGNISRNSDGTFSFCDTNQDKKADGVGAGTTFITAVNGTARPSSLVIINEPIPTSGTITITIDSATRNQRVRIVGWQDKNNNGQIDLQSAGDVDCDFPQPYDATTDGALTVSGRKFYFGPEGQFGSQFGGACVQAFRHNSSTQTFSAGTSGASSLRFKYDSNDSFSILGTTVTLATFKSQLGASTSTANPSDFVTVSYDPNPAGISSFNICINRGYDAPAGLSGAIGNFDNGSSAEDVRLTYTSPATNSSTTFNVQRAALGKDSTGADIAATAANCTPGNSTNPNGSGVAPPSNGLGSTALPANSAFSTVGTTSTLSGGESGTFTNFDLSVGGYCFRLSITNPDLGITSVSNYIPVNITSGAAGDTGKPASTAMNISSSGGFANTLDSGDKFFVRFDEGISVAPNAVIRFTDSDCGPATNTGPATCSGAQTNTVADVICGTNATCQLDGTQGLIVTMTANPTVVAAGSTAGLQFPVVVTDSTGVTDLSGNAWDLACDGQSTAGAACANGTAAAKRVMP